MASGIGGRAITWVPGAGQQSAAEATRECANKRARDLSDFIGQLRADGVTSLRAMADALNEKRGRDAAWWRAGTVQRSQSAGAYRRLTGAAQPSPRRQRATPLG
jgi:hypothetical protein